MDDSSGALDELPRKPSVYNLSDLAAAPLLVDILESNPVADSPDGCSITALRAWLEVRESDTEGILSILRDEGLVVDHNDKVLVPNGDALSMAESPAVKRLFRQFILSNPERVADMVKLAYRDDRVRVLDSLLGMLTQTEFISTIRLLCERRIRDTSSAAEIFRVDSADTAILSSFNRSHTSLVRSLVLKPVELLMQAPAAFEADRAMPFPILQEGNLLNLRNLSQLFFQSLQENFDQMIASQDQGASVELALLPKLCLAIREEALKKFADNMADVSVLNFLVLRKLSPAIVFPDVYLQLPKPNASQRRVLLLFAKIVQSVCNGEPMTEPLSVLNDLVQQHHEKFKAFLLSLSTYSSPSLLTPRTEPPSMSKHRLAECLLELGMQQPAPDMSSETFRKALSCSSPEFSLERFLSRCRFAAAQQSSDNLSVSDSESEVGNDFFEELRKAQELVNASESKELKETLSRLAILATSMHHQDSSKKSKASEDSERTEKSRRVIKPFAQQSSGRSGLGTFLAPK